MKLTDAEKAVLDPIVREVANEYGFDDRNDIDPIPWEKANPNAVAGGILRAYLAGKRAGREDMRERAARVCRFATGAMSPETAKLLDQLADDIRALGVDDE